MASKITLDSKLQNLLAETVRKIKADYAEIRAEEALSTLVVFRGEEPDLISEPSALGFFVRVKVNGSWGIATFNDILLIKQKIDEAVSFAKLQGPGQVVLAGPVKSKDVVDVPFKKDFRKIPLFQKVALVKNYNQLLLKGARGVQTSFIVYEDRFLTKYFVNSNGSRVLQTRPYVRVSFRSIAQKNGVIEIYRGSAGHLGGFEAVEGLDSEMVKAAKEAVALTRVPKVSGGIYTAIVDPLMAGTFAHEAFGHLSEADHQYEDPKLLEQMKIGRKLGGDKVTIVDDPGIPGGWGNYCYDDEGVKAEKVYLMSRGVITGRLHSLETAGKLGEVPNGRARADGFSSKPIVRMSNTFFEPGKENLKDMISSTKKGILVINWLGGMTALENFTFTAMYGVMIENGKLTQKVRGVKLLGNVFETLKNIDGVSSDFMTDQGTCGKDGQSMPVGSGGGYVRINKITVGGQ